MNMKQSCKALICAIEGELDGRHCTEEQAAAILDHALPSLTEALARAKSELAEAVGLLRCAMESSSFREILTLERDIAAFLARLAQAEQQEAQEIGPLKGEFAEAAEQAFREQYGLHEAQGAQAGDGLKWLSVTNILLDVVPGPDGMGHEVYAESVEQVERRLCDLGDKVEELKDDLARARVALATQPADVDAFTNALEVMEGFTGEDWTEMIERFPLLAEQVEGYASRKEAEASGICQRPPEGWVCSRKPGHNGPCAASVSAPPAAAHGDEAVRIDARLLELYQAPFRFDERGGYIWDAQNNMVADNHVDGDQAMRVRGWGRLSYRQDGEEVQDLMGQAMADALTARWEAAMHAQAGEGGE